MIHSRSMSREKMNTVIDITAHTGRGECWQLGWVIRVQVLAVALCAACGANNDTAALLRAIMVQL